MLCGSTCGYCIGRRLRIDSNNNVAAAAAPSTGDSTATNLHKAPVAEDRWQPIDRVAASNLSYSSFVKLYKTPGKPVILEGWLQDHPQLERFEIQAVSLCCAISELTLCFLLFFTCIACSLLFLPVTSPGQILMI